MTSYKPLPWPSLEQQQQRTRQIDRESAVATIKQNARKWLLNENEYWDTMHRLSDQWRTNEGRSGTFQAGPVLLK
jgi:hypothetical protein